MDEQNDVMNPVFIGYLPKRTARRPDWLAVPHVQEICSASLLHLKGPSPVGPR